VGAAAFSGHAVAWADTSDSGSSASSEAPSAANSDAGSTRSPRTSPRGRGASTTADASASVDPGPQPQTRISRDNSTPDIPDIPEQSTPETAPPPLVESVPADFAPVEAASAPSANQAAETWTNSVNAAPAAALAPPADPLPAAVTIVDPVLIPVLEPAPTAAPTGAVSGFLSKAGDLVTDDAGTGSLPVAMPLEWAYLAYSRRELSGPAASVDPGPVAKATTSEPLTKNGITVNPTTALVDGIIQGTMQATSERGNPLTFSWVDSRNGVDGTNGGKVVLGSVPVGNLPTPDAKPVTDPQSYTILPYATWLDPGVAKTTQQFSIRVTEVTEFDEFVTGIPLIGLVAAPVITLLQQLPLISDLLAPIIGASILATINVDVAALTKDGAPVAFTYRVPSFDGTLISTNYFPASGLTAGDEAPAALFGPGLGGGGEVNPYGYSSTNDFTPTVAALRAEDYNVVTWAPRGNYDSGGVLQLDNPFYEGRDASAIVSWLANPSNNLGAALNGPGDPKVGMVGGSYGGGIQWVTASTDPRIDAIVPAISWNSLPESLYPSEIFKTSWGNFLLLALEVLPPVTGNAAGARINDLIYQAILTGNLFGRVGESPLAMVNSSGPTVLLNKLEAPALIVQGTYDSLFPLDQAVTNAQTILANPYDTPVKMIWFCGGHGACNDEAVPAPADQRTQIYADTFAWLNQYVKGEGTAADAIPTFQWYDQRNALWTSDLFSFDEGFNKPQPLVTTSDGGSLAILPLLGGSGSSGVPEQFKGTPLATLYRFPFDRFIGVGASVASNAINVPITVGVRDQVVGAPELTFTYSGLGTSRAVFAQIVEGPSPEFPDGRVLGGLVTAVPVTLDGKEHTVSMPLQQIAYSQYPDRLSPPLSLQITSSATQFANSAIGFINISDINLELPVRA
jgi:ABC-2 type transport system ATP-binding protein